MDAANLTCFYQMELDCLQFRGKGIYKEIKQMLSEECFKSLDPSKLQIHAIVMIRYH